MGEGREGNGKASYHDQMRPLRTPKTSPVLEVEKCILGGLGFCLLLEADLEV